MVSNLKDLFQALDLDTNEIKTYLTIVENGSMTASQISKIINIPRSTIYGFLDTLVDKGLIFKSAIKSKTCFVALDPKEAFQKYIAIEKEKLLKKEKSIEELSDFLMPYFSRSTNSIPRIKVFEGKKSIESMLKYYEPKWRESYLQIGEDTMWGFQDHTFVDEYKNWHKTSWKFESQREKICLFSTKEGVRQQKNEKIKNREIRLLPKGYEFKSSIWVHGEYVILGSTRQEPHQVILIYDSIISSNLRTVFKLLWKLT